MESAQKAYDVVVQRYTESNLQSQASQTNISVLTQATEPIEPSAPRLLLNMLIAVLVGVQLGLGGVFVMEMIDQRVRTTGTLISATGVPVLIELTQNLEPRGKKGWLKKLADMVLLKFKFRKLW